MDPSFSAPKSSTGVPAAQPREAGFGAKAMERVRDGFPGPDLCEPKPLTVCHRMLLTELARFIAV